MQTKTLGIIGGMGPLATADLFCKITVNTKARADHEHLRVLIDSNPAIPDRTQALLYGGKSPLDALVESAQTLDRMGAQLLLLPCHTAHCYFHALQRRVKIPILNMVALTVQALLTQRIRCVGLLATQGTVQSGLYHAALRQVGIATCTPHAQELLVIGDLIYRGVKGARSDYDVTPAKAVFERMLGQGAQTLLLACTELPLAMERYRLDYPAFDPTLVLARAAIRAANGTCVGNAP